MSGVAGQHKIEPFFFFNLNCFLICFWCCCCIFVLISFLREIKNRKLGGEGEEGTLEESREGKEYNEDIL